MCVCARSGCSTPGEAEQLPLPFPGAQLASQNGDKSPKALARGLGVLICGTRRYGSRRPLVSMASGGQGS